MEANVCDVSHLDANALLPPRKRLLAGLKKQNSDGNSNTPSPSSAANELETRFDRGILRSHLNDPNLSSEEIIELSRLAAEAAVRVLEAARAAAEEKATKAAKAVAAAKIALEWVAIVSEEAAGREGGSLKKKMKNKMKRQVPVQMLYNKHEFVECTTDEELARLHQDMNNSPRISKNSTSYDLKCNKHKKLRSLSSSGTKSRAENGGVALDGKQPSMSNGNGIAGELKYEGSIPQELDVMVGENILPLNRTDLLKMYKGEAEMIQAKEKIGEPLDDTSIIGRKRGRLKQKKLPLSICNYRDRTNPKEESKSRTTLMAEKKISKTFVSDKPVFSVECSSSSIIPVEKMSVRKCHEFKAPPACAKQNKVMQS